MKFEEVDDFYQKMTDMMIRDDTHGYPHDILIDCTELMNIPESHIVFVFVKKYVSSGMIDIPAHVYDYQDIKNTLGLINHYMREIESYKTVYTFFNGVMSERDISYLWARKYILDVLWFFAQKCDKKNWALTDEQKEETSKLFEEVKRVYGIRIKGCEE